MEAVSNSALVTLSGVVVAVTVTLSEVVTAVTVTLDDDALGVTDGVTLSGVLTFLTVTLADLVGAKVVETDAVVVTFAGKAGVTDLADENNLVTKDIFVPDVTVGVTSDLMEAIESTVDVFVTLVTEVWIDIVVTSALVVTLETGVTKVTGFIKVFCDTSETGVTGVTASVGVLLSFCSDSKNSSSSSLSMTVASDSCDLKKYSFCCFKSFILCQAVDSSPQSSESYSESVAFSLSESDISTATRRAKILATSV